MTNRSVSIVIFVFWFAPALRGQGAPQDRPVFPPSKPYLEQMRERGAVRELTLHDALELALTHNLEIEVENYERQAARAATSGAEGRYDPQLGLNVTALSSDLPVNSLLQTGSEGAQITRSWSVAPSWQQNLPGGGSANLTVNLSRTSTNSDYVFINPLFGSSIGITIAQPLWRGFRRTAAEREIVVARIHERLNESQFRQKVTGTVEQVINAYWKLVVSLEDYEVQRQARDIAVAQYEQTRQKVQAGADTGAALTSARSDVAGREQSATQSAVQIIQAGNALKRLLAGSATDPVWTSEILPSDRPELVEPGISLAEAVKTAVERRPELEQFRQQMQQSEADLRLARQDAKPAVNLRLEMLSTGNAGVAYALPAAGPDGEIVRVLDPTNPAYGGVGTSYRQALRFQYPSVAAGLEIKLPLRNRAARAELAAAAVAEHKLDAQMRAAEEDILVEVRNAWETIGAQKKNVEAARLGRRLAEEQLAAETATAAGDAKNSEVLRRRRELGEARVRELQALVDYQLAVTALQKAMNTLTDEHQIVLARRE